MIGVAPPFEPVTKKDAGFAAFQVFPVELVAVLFEEDVSSLREVIPECFC